MNPELLITYKQQEWFLEPVNRTAHAEYSGFLHARVLSFAVPDFETEPRYQEAYQRGFREGKVKLEQDRLRKKQEAP